MSKKQSSGGVHIGSVGGSIVGSIIASGDVKGVTITMGGQEIPADAPPTVDKLSQLLTEIQQELAAVSAQQEALKAISATAPGAVQLAEVGVKTAAETVKPDMPQEDAKSAEQSLKEATSFLGTLLDGAKTVIEKGGEVAKAVEPVLEKLAPLAEKVAVAAVWAAKLSPLLL